MRGTSRVFAAALLLTAATMGGVAQAKDEYIFDVVKRDRTIMTAWRKIVPKDYRDLSWIAKLDGVSIPLERAKLDGKEFYLGSVCKPHDCGGNVVAFLIAVDGSARYGLLSSDLLGADKVPFGAPSPQALELMKPYVEN